ncbi:MAG TPA: acyl-CoA dehydrogenase family protein [Dehalococcoidia bacterium]|nr:acyl-CoA dehydrogenase family protein [Dehalococcoidia bacterium]
MFASLAKPEIAAVAEEAAVRIASRVDSGLQGEELLGACIDDLRATRYVALTVPTELGGLGGSVLDACVAQERIARPLGSAALAANMHISYVAQSQVSGLWQRPMLDDFLRGIVERGYMINNCQAEAEMGSPARGGLPATQARRVEGGWRLTGAKQWSTGSYFLSHFAVSATVSAPDIPQHLGQFLVERDAPGVRIEPTWDALAMRESASHDIVFEDVFVPEAHVIRVNPSGAPFTASVETAPWHGLTIAATYTGVAVAARDWVAHFAATRVPTNLGKPIGEIPGVRLRLGEIEALLLVSRRLIFDTARDWAEGGDRRGLAPQIGLVKYHAANNAIRVTDLAMRIAGGVGLSASQPLERYFRDVRSSLIHPPLDDVALDGAAKRALAEFAPEGGPPTS